MNNHNRVILSYPALIISSGVLLTLAILLGFRSKYIANVSFGFLIDTLIYLALAIFGWIFLVKKPINKMGIIPNPFHFFNFLVGIMLAIAAIVFTQIILSLPIKDIFSPQSNMLMVFVSIFVAAYREEIFFRGYYLSNLLSTVFQNKLLSSVVCGVVFGLLHNSSFGWLLSFLGIILSYGAMEIGSFWFSVGLHFAWNVFSGAAFSNAAYVLLPNILGVGIMGIIVVVYIIFLRRILLRKHEISAS